MEKDRIYLALVVHKTEDALLEDNYRMQTALNDKGAIEGLAVSLGKQTRFSSR